MFLDNLTFHRLIWWSLLQDISQELSTKQKRQNKQIYKWLDLQVAKIQKTFKCPWLNNTYFIGAKVPETNAYM